MFKKYDSLKIKYGKEIFIFNEVSFFGNEQTFCSPEPDICFDFKSIVIDGQIIEERNISDSLFSIYYPVYQKAVNYCIEDYLMDTPVLDWEGFQEWLNDNEENGFPEPMELHDF